MRSPHAHAVVQAVDATDALASRGVVDVLTAADLPAQLCTGPVRPDRPVLAAGVVRHVGEPVAAVLATDPASATRAAHTVRVDYRVLPEVHWFAGDRADPLHPDGNLLRSIRVRRGDPLPALDWSDREAFDPDRPGSIRSPLPGADLVVDGTYNAHGWVPRVEPFGIDGMPAVPATISAEPFDVGVRVAAPRRWHPADKDQLAECLSLTPRQITLESTGSTDHSTDLGAAVLAALFALRHHRPVRLVVGPSYLGLGGGPMVAMRCRHHARADGTILAVQAEIDLAAGPYAGVFEAVVAQLCAIGVGPYRVPAVDLQVRALRATTPPPMVEPGAVPAVVAFAVEAQLDRLARRISDADYTDAERCLAERRAVRRRNLLALEDPLPTGQMPLEDSPIPELFAALDEVALPEVRDSGSERAWGIGEGVGMIPFGVGEGADTPVWASVRLEADRAVVRCAAAEGDPGLEAAALAVVRHDLGGEVDFEATGEPVAGGSAAAVGLAVQAAVDGLTAAARERHAPSAGLSPGLLRAVDGRLRSFDGVVDVPLVDALTGDPRTAQAWFNPVPSEPLGPDGQGDAFPGYAYAAARAVLQMSSHGEVEIAQLVVAADCGRVLDADRARAAVEASAHTGIRLALPEATVRPGAVRVHLLQGAAPKGVAGLAAGAVAAALRSAADQGAGGDAEVLPIPGVSWSTVTARRPDGPAMPAVYRDPDGGS